jgi:hypothetical protein
VVEPVIFDAMPGAGMLTQQLPGRLQPPVLFAVALSRP